MKKACSDYTVGLDMHNDYVRHKREGSEPCTHSLRAWADRQKKVRQRMRTAPVKAKVRR
jgi:hypothetical protein